MTYIFRCAHITDVDAFQEILVSSSMFTAHMPDRVYAALAAVTTATAGGTGAGAQEATSPVQQQQQSTTDRTTTAKQEELVIEIP